MESNALGLENFFATGKHSLQNKRIYWIPSIALMFSSVRSAHFWWNQRSQAARSMALVPVVSMSLHRPRCHCVGQSMKRFDLFVFGRHLAQDVRLLLRGNENSKAAYAH